MLFDKIILLCFRNIKVERTASSIYHLLKGRKSIQTVQDAYLYKMDAYYGIYPSLPKKRFAHKIVELQNNQLLLKTSEGYYEVTIRGSQVIKETKKDLEGFYGIEFQQILIPFRDRLFLLIQTLTNTYRQNFNFIPVTDKWVAENFVKKAYQKYRGNLEQVLLQFHNELHRLLLRIDGEEAAIFVDRLSGYKNYGASIDQLSQRYTSNHDDSRP